jgi:hypothetical protein
MKICIELDELMEKRWGTVKEILEQGCEFVYGIEVSLLEKEIFEGLFFCFEDDIGSFHFPKSFSEEELEAMEKRRK